MGLFPMEFEEWERKKKEGIHDAHMWGAGDRAGSGEEAECLAGDAEVEEWGSPHLYPSEIQRFIVCNEGPCCLFGVLNISFVGLHMLLEPIYGCGCHFFGVFHCSTSGHRRPFWPGGVRGVACCAGSRNNAHAGSFTAFCGCGCCDAGGWWGDGICNIDAHGILALRPSPEEGDLACHDGRATRRHERLQGRHQGSQGRIQGKRVEYRSPWEEVSAASALPQQCVVRLIRPTLNCSVVNPPTFHVSTVTFPSVGALREAAKDYPFRGLLYGR